MKNINAEEYDDPVLYDKENDTYMEDLSYLLKWASKTKVPIIDIVKISITTQERVCFYSERRLNIYKDKE
ncbi:hypothetical protein [Peribacillus muralis]|uniref:hypothetical protein n=1 Tax=Peribacillus muralis TaxID=264697 RepID=UPI003D01739D